MRKTILAVFLETQWMFSVVSEECQILYLFNLAANWTYQCSHYVTVCTGCYCEYYCYNVHGVS